MADTNLGGVYYEVDAKTGGLLNLQSQVNKTTDAIAKDFKQADQSVSAANKGIATSMTKTAQAVDQAKSSMGNLRGVAGNLGFQLQDIAVQAQAGTSAFVILGQQGSQIASAFGPGGAVLGAVIAIAAAIGGTLVAAIKSAKETAATLPADILKQLEIIEKKFNETDEISRAALAQVETGKFQTEISDVQDKIEKLNKENEVLFASFAAGNEAAGRAFERNQERIATLTQRAVDLGKAQERVNFLAVTGKEGFEDLGKALDQPIDKVTQLKNQLEIALTKTTEGELAASRLAAAFYLGLTNAEMLPPEIDKLIVKQYEAEKAQKALNEQMKLTEKNMLAELQDEQNQRNTITTEFEQVQKGITADIETPAQKAERELAERLAVIQKYNQLETVEEAKKTQTGVMAQKAYEAQLTRIKKDEEAKRLKMNSDTLGYTADLFGNLAQLAEAGGKKSFNAWKLFASAQAAVNAALAITNVLATVPAPFNFALAGTVAAVTGAQIATINSQSYGGGRLYGGPVQAGTMYPITENGKPEILQQGNKQYLLPGSSGNVISNKDMMAQGGSNVSVEVNVHTGASQDSVKQRQGPNKKEIIDIWVADFVAGGQTQRVITTRTTARGTTR
jgi:hypothetical protein